MPGLLLKEAPTDGTRSYHCEIDPSHETNKQRRPALHLRKHQLRKLDGQELIPSVRRNLTVCCKYSGDAETPQIMIQIASRAPTANATDMARALSWFS